MKRRKASPNQEASYVNVRADSSEDTELSAVSSRVVKIYGFILGTCFLVVTLLTQTLSLIKSFTTCC